MPAWAASPPRWSKQGGALLVTADHGNCELMRDPATGGPHTAHTTNPVPVLLMGGERRGAAGRPARRRRADAAGADGADAAARDDRRLADPCPCGARGGIASLPLIALSRSPPTRPDRPRRTPARREMEQAERARAAEMAAQQAAAVARRRSGSRDAAPGGRTGRRGGAAAPGRGRHRRRRRSHGRAGGKAAPGAGERWRRGPRRCSRCCR